jgi:hypothetical protein
VLHLVGHFIYGAILGYGYWRSRAQEADWPLRFDALRAIGSWSRR